MQREESVNPFTPQPAARETVERQEPQLEPEAIWRARLEREAEEQYLRERHRQRMARLQANDAAYDSPLAVGPTSFRGRQMQEAIRALTVRPEWARRLGRRPLRSGAPGGARWAESRSKRPAYQGGFLQRRHQGAWLSPEPGSSRQLLYELKRGSVIPATLITGINSDLPGRITAQVSQNVDDSATGHRL